MVSGVQASGFGLQASAQFPFVPGFGREPRVLDRHPHREVIEALERMSLEPEQVVYRVVVEASDAGCAPASGLGFEIQRLTHHAGLPEEIPVEGWTVVVEARGE